MKKLILSAFIVSVLGTMLLDVDASVSKAEGSLNGRTAIIEQQLMKAGV